MKEVHRQCEERPIMGAVHVLMLILLWTFAAFCKTEMITCDDVTGHVGDKLTLTCRVSYQSDTCSIEYHKFINKEGTQICREKFTDSCKQLIIFSCSYTANEVMTSTFNFFIQTKSGLTSADFTVTIADAVKKDTDITCDDVTGHVGDKVNFTCRVSYQSNKCNMLYFKFINKDKGTTICREDFTDSCKQLSIFSCPYTANETMTSSFKFFIQTTSGAKEKYFTVTIADAVKDHTDGPKTKEDPEKIPKEDTSPLVVIICVVSVLIIIAIMGFILKRKCNS